MTTITVFTPTYNRAYSLGQVYSSLLNQTNKDFKWLIVDDGSTDDTRELVGTWIKEYKIDIEYIYQENRGMVFAHNTAHHAMKTDLCVCIDSDDYMPNDAIEKILALWEKHGYVDCAGIVGLDAFESGDIIGTKLPDVKECRFSELYAIHKISGDKKFVHNRKVFNKFLPYKFFDNEHFPVTSYLYLLIEQEHKFLIFNEVFCIVEYQEDGLSMNLFNQYKKSPKSFAFYRIAKMKYALNYKERFLNAVHYVSSSLMASDAKFMLKTSYKITVLLAIPLGTCLYLYIMYSGRKALIKI